MAFELVYTSVPKGLKAGTRGFCTVAFTEGMPANYVQVAESLSGYRNVFPPNDPQYAVNPVAYSHYRLLVGGQRLSILSRVAAYGTDYSGRTNNIAHHILARPNELEPGGPAGTMLARGFFVDEWREDPRLIRGEKRLPNAEASSCRANEWERITGDAGWAAIIAQAFLDAPQKPAFVAFNPGTSVLPLVAEVIALLPPEKRWEFTFSTYVTTLPQGSDCWCRCCLPDAPPLRDPRLMVGALVVNLADPSRSRGPTPSTSGSPLVACARSGQKPMWPSARMGSTVNMQSTGVHLSPASVAPVAPRSGAKNGARSSSDGRRTFTFKTLPGVAEPFALPKRRRPAASMQGIIAGMLIAAAMVAVVVLGLVLSRSEPRHLSQNADSLGDEGVVESLEGAGATASEDQRKVDELLVSASDKAPSATNAAAPDREFSDERNVKKANQGAKEADSVGEEDAAQAKIEDERKGQSRSEESRLPVLVVNVNSKSNTFDVANVAAPTAKTCAFFSGKGDLRRAWVKPYGTPPVTPRYYEYLAEGDDDRLAEFRDGHLSQLSDSLGMIKISSDDQQVRIIWLKAITISGLKAEETKEGFCVKGAPEALFEVIDTMPKKSRDPWFSCHVTIAGDSDRYEIKGFQRLKAKDESSLLTLVLGASEKEELQAAARRRKASSSRAESASDAFSVKGVERIKDALMAVPAVPVPPKPTSATYQKEKGEYARSRKALQDLLLDFFTAAEDAAKKSETVDAELSELVRKLKRMARGKEQKKRENEGEDLDLPTKENLEKSKSQKLADEFSRNEKKPRINIWKVLGRESFGGQYVSPEMYQFLVEEDLDIVLNAGATHEPVPAPPEEIHLQLSQVEFREYRSAGQQTSVALLTLTME